MQYESVDRHSLDLFGDVGKVREVAVRITDRKAQKAIDHPRVQIASPSDAYEIFWPYFRHLPAEHFLVAMLNTANVLTDYVVHTVGGLASSIVEPRAIFQAAILCNANSIILMHNHPSGNPEPSREDIKITRQITEAGKLLGIPVYDHIIMTYQGHTSLAERNLLR